MILVTAAGKVGAEAARLLPAQGEPVRILARNPEKVAASLTHHGALITGAPSGIAREAATSLAA